MATRQMKANKVEMTPDLSDKSLAGLFNACSILCDRLGGLFAASDNIRNLHTKPKTDYIS